MKIVLDMNLSPDWKRTLQAGGHQAVHWSEVGSHSAPDEEIMRWASENNYAVFTHDLDFSAILAATQGVAPSVLQMRTQAPTPSAMSETVLRAIRQFERELLKGAIVVIDQSKSRARVLPLRK